jgi:hypothetical protein
MGARITSTHQRRRSEDMIIEILFVVVMFLWLLTILPLPPMAPFASSNVFFAFVAVLLLGLFIFLPGIR